MKRALRYSTVAFLCACAGASAQEAGSGVDVRATVTGQFAASSMLTQPGIERAPATFGVRAVVYPTLKLSDHWTATAAWQLYTRPYFFDSFAQKGSGAKGTLLQGTLNYSRVSEKGSLVARAGMLSTAFGSFLLRYDDAENPLVDLPQSYGYYYEPVTSLAVAGAQVDATSGRWDGRVQFANSSPVNPRSVFARDQYGNWAGGAGVTIRQGFRIGVSGYRGPYLSRDYAFFFPGEANPNTQPAHALGTDVQWARGHWNVQGEFQRFFMPYVAIPNFREDAGYGEVRRVLHPRWYVASRIGYASATFGGTTTRYEFAAGYRPGRHELIKAGYQLNHHNTGSIANDNTFAVQFITTLHASHALR
ncbi:MAG TPA: hypothetical protein VHU44_03240 [Acidobacteriaceae bacterium]|jgi:hypothetical protein|nr:hypothetical protein [Acidobacteriaceae bacterium]